MVAPGNYTPVIARLASSAGSSPAAGTIKSPRYVMLTKWVLIIVLTKGLQPSLLQVEHGFISEAECKTIAQQVTTPADRWKCFYVGE